MPSRRLPAPFFFANLTMSPLLLLLISFALQQPHSSVLAAPADHSAALTSWLRATEGGFLHASVVIRPVSASSASLGVFATTDIAQGESLLTLPRALVYGSADHDDPDLPDPVCHTALMLWHDLRDARDEPAKANAGPYAPYIRYLSDQSDGQIPSAWSDAGKKLLNAVRGKDLPPRDMTTFSFHRECGPGFNDENDRLGDHAFNIVMQRGWDQLLLPIYDMMSHANGPGLNTQSNSVHTEAPVKVTALRDIAQGEQITTTYDMCVDCGNRQLDYGVPEFVRDYGFVETYPQRWAFPFEDEEIEDIVAYRLEENQATGQIDLTWLTDTHEDELAMRILMTNLERLEQMDLPNRKANIPDHEFAVIQQFYDSLVASLRIAVPLGYNFDDDNIEDVVDECTIEADGSQTCAPPTDREYDNLVGEEYGWNEHAYQCYEGRFMDFPEHTHLEWVRSQYQEIQYFQLQRNLDTCFRLDGTIQICGAYRPHYHELVVHNTARYFKDVKRVVFVGGGDSMLLHEILKYPSLELVVGLEIDQKVTRGAFKYWGSQPHWDNDKVQWWFGDAGKSLLMLPKEYFGSFDMVLVDLSETVTSMLVTDGLDIMTALGFLLQPEGVLVKNELYFGKMSRIFPNTIQVGFEDIPVICAQALSLGSPGRNFLSPVRYDHGVADKNVVYRHSGTDDAYTLLHDYMYNKQSDYTKNCLAAGAKEPEPKEQTASPGILMILEAEDVKPKIIQSNKKLQDAVSKVLKAAGFDLLSTLAATDDNETVVFILKEGYIAVRCWPEQKYCAFDVLLWSSFEKHNTLKAALVAIVEGKTSSQYRVVTGGMFGVSTWKNDAQQQGPRRPDCTPDNSPVGKGVGQSQAISDAILVEGLSYINASKPVLALVLCPAESHTCPSAEIVSSHGNVKETLVLKSCSDGSADSMIHCEREAWNKIDAATENGKKIGAVILDTKAPKEIAQIVVKIFGDSYDHKKKALQDGLVVVATMEDSKELWRRAFLHRFVRDVVVYEPLFRGIAQFTGKQKTGVEMGLFSSVNNTEFVGKFLQSVDAIQQKHQLASEVRHIGNGLWRYLPDFTTSIFGRAGHYDHTDALKQWQSQKPLARQTIFQFDLSDKNYKPLDVGDSVMANYNREGEYFAGKVIKMHEDGSCDILYEDNDYEARVSPRNIQRPAPAPAKMEPPKNLQEILVQSVDEVFNKPKQNQLTLENVGDGFITASTWKGGSAVLVYDGRKHVDVNFFSKDMESNQQGNFLRALTKKFPTLSLTLRDEQPRGSGRVVNYESDIAQWDLPHWMTKVDDNLFDEREIF